MWTPQDPFAIWSTLVLAMVQCGQATSHYLSQCWPSSMIRYGITRRNELTLKVLLYLLRSPGIFNTLRSRQNGCHFADILNTFSWMKTFLFFKWNFTEICSLWSNWQYGCIGSDNGLVPNRWQAIIWSNVGVFYWCNYVSLRLNELNKGLISDYMYKIINGWKLSLVE